MLSGCPQNGGKPPAGKTVYLAARAKRCRPLPGQEERRFLLHRESGPFDMIVLHDIICLFHPDFLIKWNGILIGN